MTRTERLEGITFSATSSNEPPAQNVSTYNVPLYKDNDLTERIILRPEAAIALALSIREDILFLRGAQPTSK
jgi:hypothetical protein